uniref:Protein king tubby n=1 Tax=Cacopsylla melanoneura TaxID=428564 RepID=A0A8D8Z1U1_9HEMI
MASTNIRQQKLEQQRQIMEQKMKLKRQTSSMIQATEIPGHRALRPLSSSSSREFYCYDGPLQFTRTHPGTDTSDYGSGYPDRSSQEEEEDDDDDDDSESCDDCETCDGCESEESFVLTAVKSKKKCNPPGTKVLFFLAEFRRNTSY